MGAPRTGAGTQKSGSTESFLLDPECTRSSESSGQLLLTQAWQKGAPVLKAGGHLGRLVGVWLTVPNAPHPHGALSHPGCAQSCQINLQLSPLSSALDQHIIPPNGPSGCPTVPQTQQPFQYMSQYYFQRRKSYRSNPWDPGNKVPQDM